MATLADVFQELNTLKAEGVVADYAVGGAFAMLFYAEPARTYDLDVFAMVQSLPNSVLVSLAPIYDWARAKGFAEHGGHILMYGVPVQFLTPHNSLAEDAVACARTLDYDGTPVRVMPPEHLVALAFQAGDSRRRERGWLLIESGKVDTTKLRHLLREHGIDHNIDDGKK